MALFFLPFTEKLKAIINKIIEVEISSQTKKLVNNTSVALNGISVLDFSILFAIPLPHQSNNVQLKNESHENNYNFCDKHAGSSFRIRTKSKCTRC